MNKRIFEKVLDEKGGMLAFILIKSAIACYISYIVIAIMEAMLIGEADLSIGEGIIFGISSGCWGFIFAFLREVHLASKK